MSMTIEQLELAWAEIEELEKKLKKAMDKIESTKKDLKKIIDDRWDCHTVMTTAFNALTDLEELES